MGSRLILILMLPLYTQYMTQVEFGTVDMVTVIAQLLVPVVSLSVYDAVFRFTMDGEGNPGSSLANGLFVSLVGILAAAIVVTICVSYFGFDVKLMWYGFGILSLQACRSLLSQFTRASREVHLFALDGVFMAIVTGIAGFVMLVVFGYGVDGYFVSILVGNGTSILLLLLFGKSVRAVSFRNVDLPQMRELVQYSLPLVPNSLMWWLMSSSSRIVVVAFLGLAANGLFAIAARIPGVLSLFTSVFTQAWQVIAVQDRESASHERVYAAVFDTLFRVNVIGISALLVVLKVGVDVLLGDGFYESWRIVPFLLIAVAFTNLSTLAGSIYITEKKTLGVFATSILGGILNVVLCLLLVQVLGLVGAGIAKMVASGAMCLARIVDTRKYLMLSLDGRMVVIHALVLGAQVGVMFANLPLQLEVAALSLLLVVLLVINIGTAWKVFRALGLAR